MLRITDLVVTTHSLALCDQVMFMFSVATFGFSTSTAIVLKQLHSVFKPSVCLRQPRGILHSMFPAWRGDAILMDHQQQQCSGADWGTPPLQRVAPDPRPSVSSR